MEDNISEILNGSAMDPNDPCYFEKHEFLETKLILISICGTTVATLGILGNVTTMIVLTRPGMRTPNNLYLTFLAVFDTLLLIAAICLYSLEYIFEYLDSLPLYNFWLKIVRYGFAMSHVAQTGSVYITVAVTFERYLAVLYPKRAKTMCTHDRTVLTIAIVVGFAGMFNSTKYFEVQVVENPNCTGFGAARLMPSDLLNNHTYQTVHSLWLTQMVMVFIPFIVLFFVNTAIVCKVRRSLKRLSWIQRGKKRNQLKEKSRDATKVLLVIVLVFLVCNSWGFIITLLENLYSEGSLREWWPEFYAFSREAVNFLAIVNSSINFVIYCIFGKDFRRELVSVWGCYGLVMMPNADRFTAESLMGDQENRRKSAFFRYINLVRQTQAIKDRDGEKRSGSSENSQEKKDPGTHHLRAVAQAMLVAQHTNNTSSNKPQLRDITDKHGRGGWKRATISSGEINGDFVSIGREDTGATALGHELEDHQQQHRYTNGDAASPPPVAPLAKPESPPLSPWKRMLMSRGWIGSASSSTSARASASSSGKSQTSKNAKRKESKEKKEKEKKNSIVGAQLTPDSEPFAPFLLGMLITSGQNVRKAGVETAVKNFEEEDVWV